MNFLGVVSKGMVDIAQNNAQMSTASNTGLIIGASIAVGVLIIVFAIFSIIVFGVGLNFIELNSKITCNK